MDQYPEPVVQSSSSERRSHYSDRSSVAVTTSTRVDSNGYLVLRHLAEDVAKDLDSVLDGILRSLTARRAPTVTTHAVTIVRSGGG